MNVSIKKLNTDWHDIDIALTDSDIDLLIERLQSLRQQRGHFHFRRNDFSLPGGIADVQIYWTDQAPSNMVVE
jgi:hypothetical protein